MAENSGIEWTDDTFNPWRGCIKVSPACQFCYAKTRSDRFGEDFSVQRIVLSDAGWKDPIKWNKKAEADGVRRKVFCASLADVFEDWSGPMVDHNGYSLSPLNAAPVGDGTWDKSKWWFCDHTDSPRITMNDVRRRLFELIDATPHLDWLLLTKRPENVRRFWPEYSYDACLTGDCPHDKQADCDKSIELNKRRDNVWIGTTVENQEQADKRIPELLKGSDLSPCLFLSCEPLLGGLDVGYWLDRVDYDRNDIDCYHEDKEIAYEKGIDWVIAGGESGTNARPSHPDWFRGLRDQCDAAGVPFHFKQWGEWLPGHMGDYPKKSPGHKWVNRIPEDEEQGSQICYRVGKKKAGRLLDGVEHNGTPAPIKS